MENPNPTLSYDPAKLCFRVLTFTIITFAIFSGFLYYKYAIFDCEPNISSMDRALKSRPSTVVMSCGINYDERDLQDLKQYIYEYEKNGANIQYNFTISNGAIEAVGVSYESKTRKVKDRYEDILRTIKDLSGELERVGRTKVSGVVYYDSYRLKKKYSYSFWMYYSIGKNENRLSYTLSTKSWYGVQ